MDAESHTAEIARRDRIRIDGAMARQRLEALTPVFEEARADTTRDLILKTIEDREIAADMVWELVALHRLEQKLRRKISSGEKNATKLAKIADMARSDVNG